MAAALPVTGLLRGSLKHACRVHPILRHFAPISVSYRPSPLYESHFRCYASQKTGSPLQEAYDKYEHFLKTRFPRVYKVHRMVVDGASGCYTDLKCYGTVNYQLIKKEKTLTDLSRKELETLFLCRQEILRLVTLLALLEIPIVGETVFVLMLFFPRLLLTRHFWSSKQKEEFWEISYRHKRQAHHTRLLDQLKSLSGRSDLRQEEMNPKESEALRSVFDQEKLSLSTLPSAHLFDLCRLYNVFPAFGAAKRLQQKIVILRAIDSQLNKTGVVKMPREELLLHLWMRQIPAAGRSEAEMQQSLKQWIQISTS